MDKYTYWYGNIKGPEAKTKLKIKTADLTPEDIYFMKFEDLRRIFGEVTTEKIILGRKLWAGIGSSRCPVGGNVAEELRAPEVEESAQEVSLTDQLVAGTLFDGSEDALVSVDDGVGTGNAYVGVMPGIVIESVLVGHKVADSMCLDVTCAASTVAVVGHDVIDQVWILERCSTELIHHAIEGSNLLVQVIG